MTLISELINVPERVNDGDYVLKLTQGVDDAHAASTVGNYVVTDDLIGAFDEALGLIGGAISSGNSQATFLHGSFGSGKSHFMAVLHLLLKGNPAARGIPELHAAIDQADKKLTGKKILLVPLHFLAAGSMDAEILGGYVRHISELHPDAPLPRVHIVDHILNDELPATRALSEEAFLQKLNEAAGSDDWGDIAAEWSTETVDAALVSTGASEARQDLGRDFIAAFRPATVVEAQATGSGYIDIDTGLAEISHHAKSLGYDAIVLFLDELILWLASNIGNLDFVQAESQKLTKLVESNHADRPAPIVSFVARQRDLKELVGDHIVGAELRSFADNIELQTGRFGKIVLEDRNLPVIAKRRILKPKDDNSAVLLHTAIDDALANHEDITRQLLTTDADLELFRDVYPFSPALVQTLIAVSEALQRERTALKVMLQLLVDGRDTLELGELVPVGDLWNVVAARDEPFSADLKRAFDTAKNLYRTKLQPMLRNAHDLADNDAATPAYLGDDRLVKTMLLGALVNKVEALRDLDASRLVALNWGSVTSPIPGHETQIVANKLRSWSAQIGEIQISDDPTNPRVSIALVDVDTQPLIDRAIEKFDNVGSRRQALRRIIDDELGHRIGDNLSGSVSILWRGTERTAEVSFANVRDAMELPDAALKATPGRPKIVIDFPFDKSGRGPNDDIERLDRFVEANGPTHTVCWLPSFLTTDGLNALRTYVALDNLLTGTRYDDETASLSDTQRREAKPILTSRRDELRNQLKDAILAAYGVTSSHPFVDSARSLTHHFRSLDPALDIRPTTSPSFEGSFDELCDQMIAHLYPDHPRFSSKITAGHRRSVWAEVRRAIGDEDGRTNVEPSKRSAMNNLADTLELGQMHESHFVISPTWQQRLDRYLEDAKKRGTTLTVGEMRSHIDEGPNGSRGLPNEIADLVVLTVAAQTDHALIHAGRPITPYGGSSIPSDAILRPEKLPSQEDWELASERASHIFGVTASPMVSAPEVASLADQVRGSATQLAPAARSLQTALIDTAGQVKGITEGDRIKTAKAAVSLMEQIAGHTEAAEVVAVLAAADIPTTAAALGRSLSSAAKVESELANDNSIWDLIEAAGHGLPAELLKLLTADELVSALEPGLRSLRQRATAQVIKPPIDPPPIIKPPSKPVGPGGGGDTGGSGDAQEEPHRAEIGSAGDIDKLAAELREEVSGDNRIAVTWQRLPISEDA